MGHLIMKLFQRVKRTFHDWFQQKDFPPKKVLVLEGGGMRGVFLTGVLQAFSDRGYFPWKMITGSSAGALTGTAYAAGQIYLARDAFFSELLTGDFIHYSHLLKRDRHVLDLDWLINTIIKGDEPLNDKTLKKSVPIIITATECAPFENPRTVYFSSRKDDIPVILKATAALPVLYRGFVEYRGKQHLDGGILDPIPYRQALDRGFREEDILVVLTRPRGYRKNEESFIIKQIYENYYGKREYRPLVEALENRFLEYNRIIHELEYSRMDVIYPPKGFRVNRLTREPDRILEGFTQGIQAGIRFLRGIH